MDLTMDAIALPEQVTQPTITRETAGACHAASPRRICFATTHQTALKTKAGDGYVGSFGVPFVETVYPIFYRMTELDLYKSKQFPGWWRSLKTSSELTTVKKWIASMGTTVFLRDTLALSIALGENQLPEGGHSELGSLEHAAKYNREEKAIRTLCGLVADAIRRLPYYGVARAICAVPPRPGKDFDLPTLITQRLAKTLELPDITPRLKWKAKKPSLKEVTFDEKWEKLEAVGLAIEGPIKESSVLLIDDLYQSGVTMQFVAMHLIAAGAKKVYGLAFVKSRGDSDNK